MKILIHDIRYAVRTLRKSPSFTVMAVLTLALGIGANTAIFSVVNAVLLRSLPFPDADRLVWIEGVNASHGITASNVSAADVADWQNQNQVFEAMSPFVTGGAILSGGDAPERVPRAAVGGGFFSVLGVSPARGRAFLPEENLSSGAAVAVISHGLWQRRFGGDPDLVGRQVTISGRSATVIGVMPLGFEFPQRIEVWTPLRLDPNDPDDMRRDNRSLEMMARLKPNVTLEQAQAQMSTITNRLALEHIETNSGWGVKLTNLQERMVGELRPALLLLLGAVLFVLLIVCANVANLLLTRAVARRKEIALRTALGASRWRIVRQLLTESLLLAALGGALGLLLGVWLTDLLVAISPADAPRFDEINLDVRVVGFTVAVTCFIGLLFGLAPAVQASKTDLNETLKEGGRGFYESFNRRGARLRPALVVAEVALALMLLIGAGLLVKSFARLQDVNPGFNPENVLTMRVALPASRYPEARQQAEFFRALVERAGALPGVESAAAVLSIPLGGSNFSVGRSFIPEGRPLTVEESINAGYVVATPGYFRTMQIPLRQGRDFTERDTAESTQVVVINETLARRHFAGASPLGKRIRVWRDEQFPREIIGVVGDVKASNLESETNAQIYVPHAQNSSWGGMTLVARTRGEPTDLLAAVRGEVFALDREQPVHSVQTMRDVFAASVATRRVSTWLLSVFAGGALLLAAIGIYGVIAYSVTQRTHEIGVRMALGAQASDVLRLIAGHSMKLTLIGIAVGLIGAFALTRVMASLLYGVSATDIVTFTTVTLLLLIVSFLASYIPARRATKIDPMVALRYE